MSSFDGIAPEQDDVGLWYEFRQVDGGDGVREVVRRRVYNSASPTKTVHVASGAARVDDVVAIEEVLLLAAVRCSQEMWGIDKSVVQQRRAALLLSYQ